MGKLITTSLDVPRGTEIRGRLNAVAESFFVTLKNELVYQYDFDNPAEARRSLFKYMEVFCNRVRRHSAPGGMSPEQFE